MTKNIGQIQNRVLIKSGKQVVLFRAIDGFGVSRGLIESDLLDGVVVTYEGVQYGVSTKRFREYGVPYHRPPYEEQIILPRRYWSIREENTDKTKRA